MGKGLDWLIRGGEQRPSRLHDYDGRFLPASSMVDLPVVLWQALRRRHGGKWPSLPWIPYPAIRRLNALIQRNWRILEFGSGYSTIWLSKRAGFVRSMESDKSWYERIKPRLRGNDDYRLAQAEEYWRVDATEEGMYDLVIVDGILRERCMPRALLAVRPRGYVYIDNIDTGGREAYAELQRRAQDIRLFTGFPPGQPTVTTGALGHMP